MGIFDNLGKNEEKNEPLKEDKKHKTEIKNFKCITNGIYTISEFEKITTNKL